MGKNKTPSYNPPAPPTLKSADELFGSATNYAKANTPLAYGARESGLADLAKGNDYYAGFQPTSFEQALGNQYFQNVWPQQEESIKHGLSLSGLDSSPILAQMLSQEKGKTQFDIGSYLNQQGNQRATDSLNARLGITPDSVLQGYLNTDQNQSNSNATNQWDYQQQLAQAQYQQAVDKYNQQNALYKTIGMISPIGGAIYGGVSGGSNGFAQSAGGSMDMLKTLMPILASGGLNGMFSSGGSAGAVNPSAYSTMASSPVNYGMNSSPYNPNQYFANLGGRGGNSIG